MEEAIDRVETSPLDRELGAAGFSDEQQRIDAVLARLKGKPEAA